MQPTDIGLIKLLWYHWSAYVNDLPTHDANTYIHTLHTLVGPLRINACVHVQMMVATWTVYNRYPQASDAISWLPALYSTVTQIRLTLRVFYPSWVRKMASASISLCCSLFHHVSLELVRLKRSIGQLESRHRYCYWMGTRFWLTALHYDDVQAELALNSTSANIHTQEWSLAQNNPADNID